MEDGASSSPDSDDARHLSVNGNKSKQKQPEEHQEIINGHLFIDGIDMGEAKSGALSTQEDVLNLLGIPASYPIPDKIMLPADLANVKFSREPNGFSRDDVVEFYNGVVESIDYIIDLLNKRNADVTKLANYIDKLNEDIHDKDVEMVIQSSGLSVITGDDENTTMNLSLKNKKLKAELDAMKSKNSESESFKKLTELQKKYDEIQNQLAMEQYSNKQLREELSSKRVERNLQEENGTKNIEESSPSRLSKRTPQKTSHASKPVDKQNGTPVQHKPSARVGLPHVSLKSRSIPQKPQSTDDDMMKSSSVTDDDFGGSFDEISDQILGDGDIDFDVE